MSVSCEQATELVEKKLAFKLSFSEKFQLGKHLAMCMRCKRYNRQSKKLDSLFKQESTSSLQKLELTPEQKEEILKNCRKY